jgi:dsRNA-specific ribonuclease
LSLNRFVDKDIQNANEKEIDLGELEDKFVKYFSDTLESIIGAIFLDSKDLAATQAIVLKLAYSPLV